MIDTSNGPVAQVQAEIWLFKKKLDFQKNVKVHIFKKANYIEVLRLFYPVSYTHLTLPTKRIV